MKTPLKLPETKTLTINGQTVKVSALPDEIINEIQTLDKMRQDYVDVGYQLEILNLAILAKSQQISKEISELTNKQPTAQTDDSTQESK